MKRGYLFLGLFLVAAIGAFTAWEIQQRLKNPEEAAGNTMLGQPLPAFQLTDFNGTIQHSEQWHGKVRLINFWASWCPPCRREIPHFAEAYEFYADQGFVVIGIAVDETQAAKTFLDKVPQVAYPQLVGMQTAVDIGRLLGNHDGALPYSLVVDRKGVIRFIRQGELQKETLLKLIEQFL